MSLWSGLPTTSHHGLLGNKAIVSAWLATFEGSGTFCLNAKLLGKDYHFTSPTVTIGYWQLALSFSCISCKKASFTETALLSQILKTIFSNIRQFQEIFACICNYTMFTACVKHTICNFFFSDSLNNQLCLKSDFALAEMLTDTMAF